MFGGVKKIESLVFGFTIGKIQAILPIFATRMKKLKYLATATAIVISLLLGFDDSISLFADLNNIEIPSQSDCSGVSHHHHQNLTDHFFQKSLVSDDNIQLLGNYKSLNIDQPISDKFHSSIWQPPQKS
jgi:hypothetical protein